MVKLVYSPQWFYGKDIIIDIVSILVLLLIAFFSMQYFRIKRNRNNLYLALSFGVLAASFLFKILMNINIYYKVIEARDLGVVTAVYESMKQSHSLFITSFLLYWLLTLFGVYILYLIYEKHSVPGFLLGTYFIILSTYIAYPDYQVFHLTLLAILSLIAFSQLRNYLNKRYFATMLVALSFGLIALSQIFFILVNYTKSFYVAGEIIQLIGYIGLLITFIMVLRHGKKNEDRHHW